MCITQGVQTFIGRDHLRREPGAVPICAQSGAGPDDLAEGRIQGKLEAAAQRAGAAGRCGKNPPGAARNADQPTTREWASPPRTREKFPGCRPPAAARVADHRPRRANRPRGRPPKEETVRPDPRTCHSCSRSGLHRRARGLAPARVGRDGRRGRSDEGQDVVLSVSRHCRPFQESEQQLVARRSSSSLRSSRRRGRAPMAGSKPLRASHCRALSVTLRLTLRWVRVTRISIEHPNAQHHFLRQAVERHQCVQAVA